MSDDDTKAEASSDNGYGSLANVLKRTEKGGRATWTGRSETLYRPFGSDEKSSSDNNDSTVRGGASKRLR